MEIKDNSFENFESGFLIINQNWEKLRMENIYLLKPCDCHINIFTTNHLEVLNSNTVLDTIVNSTFCTADNVSGNLLRQDFKN